ncbi:MAG: ubiquinol-cytochrome c reductase iron-sulfur subunit [Lysobacteraceae bacterium]|nr:MAG: ubiquinol-cytochrome c reductase iron-sulfur subunit [Xanthomonadaceae bacterium]
MASEGMDKGRRRFLVSTTVVGAGGAAFAAVPFIKSWQPSARAKAAGAPVEADIGKIEPGQMLKFEWRSKPVWVVYRTPEVLEALPSLNGNLRDPDSLVVEQQPTYAQNEYRSVKPELLVLIGICTHLGCSPKYVPEVQPQPFDPDWKGGFFCPCHNSRFDMAGRVYTGVPAPANLKVPPYTFLSEQRILIGVDPQGAA